MASERTDRSKQVTELSPEDLVAWLHEHGDVLFRYARKRVGTTEAAEDLVQETFLAALRSADGFAGRSKVQTWLIGILRHKIADHLRRLTRQKERETQADTTYEGVFRQGNWRVGVKTWTTDPGRFIEAEEFWRVLAQCQEKLPAKLGAAFRMPDVEQLAMTEICEALEISATNLSVRLHRARILMRECLDHHWFALDRDA